MGKAKHSSRNGFIDIQKFVYACIIVLLHFYAYTGEHFPGGGHAVDFFLISSGAFFFAGYKRKTSAMSDEELIRFPVTYTKKRFLRFLPYTVPAFILAFVIEAVINDNGTGINSFVDIVNVFVGHVWDIFLLSLCGLNGGKSMINSVTWTLSAMLISEFFILSVLVRKERSFLYLRASFYFGGARSVEEYGERRL